MLRRYSHTKCESLVEIRTTMSEIQHFFLGDWFLLAHHEYYSIPANLPGSCMFCMS